MLTVRRRDPEGRIARFYAVALQADLLERADATRAPSYHTQDALEDI